MPIAVKKDALPLAAFDKATKKTFGDVRKTGKKIILENNRPAFVLQTVEEYERLIGFIEDIRIEKIAAGRLSRPRGKEIKFTGLLAKFGYTEAGLKWWEDIEIGVRQKTGKGGRVRPMNIAVVDDDDDDLDAIEDYLAQYIHYYHPEIVKDICLESFWRGEDVLASISAGRRYDLLVLDINMPGINGMEAARKVREQDDEAAIIFLTSSEDYLLDGYQVFATGYVLKPLANHTEQFAAALKKIFRKYQPAESELKLRVKEGEVNIPFERICYVEKESHRLIHVKLVDQEYYSSTNYGDCQEALLSDGRFSECYHRVIVNMEQVKFMEDEDFVMDDGTHIPISQRRRREVKAKYINYLAHK